MSNQKLLIVACLSQDCLYYQQEEEQPDRVFCSHPDKERFRGNCACPLYQHNCLKRLETSRK